MHYDGRYACCKYLNEKKSDGIVIAENFYFTSNLLDGEKHTLAPGSDTITFTLGNHEDALRYSDVDIEYTVTVDNANATVTGNTGTLEKGAVRDNEVTISNLEAGKTYTVTAVGKGGYTKTLTATIEVPQKEALLYYHVDNSASDYCLLTVWNEGDIAGNVTVTYTGIPDNTNPDMIGWQTDATNTVEILPHKSKVFRFFGENITVSVTGAAAKEPY